MLSSYIYFEFITNLSFLQPQHVFARFCLQLFLRPFNYEHWRTNDEHRATNKPEIFGPIVEKSSKSCRPHSLMWFVGWFFEHMNPCRLLKGQILFRLVWFLCISTFVGYLWQDKSWLLYHKHEPVQNALSI